MTQSDSEGNAVPQRRRVRVSGSGEVQETMSPQPQRMVQPDEYVPNGGASAAKQSVLYRLRQGWLTINDLTHLCCVARRTGELWFERLGAIPFQQTGLPGSGPDMRSRLVKRTDLEKILGDEGWRVVRSQQDDPQVLEALIGNKDYPLLSKLLTWATETPRRKLPLLDLALELQLAPSDAAFDLNREIDWADQAGLMRDELKRTDRLAIAKLGASRARQVDLADLISLEQWSEGKPFKEGTTRVLARQGKLEHLHGVVNEAGEILVWLVPSWAEILKEPEEFTAITNFELPTARAERLGESRTLIEAAVKSGTLSSYKWGRGTYVENRPLTKEEKQALEDLISDQQRVAKIKHHAEQARINYDQAKDLEMRLALIPDNAPKEVVSGRDLSNLRRMATIARMKAEGQTLESCGLWLGVTRERVRQILLKYKRFVLVAGSVENQVVESLIDTPEKSPRLSVHRQRLREALDHGSKYALVNQIFIEHFIFGATLEALYTPSLSMAVSSHRSQNIPTQPLQDATPEFYGDSEDHVTDQALRLRELIEITLSTFDEIIRQRPSVQVIREECEIAFLAVQGLGEKSIASQFKLSHNDVLHVLKKHRAKLAMLEKLEPQFVEGLSTVADRSDLPAPVLRLVRHCQTNEPFALLNALFVETQVLRTDVAELLNLIREQ